MSHRGSVRRVRCRGCTGQSAVLLLVASAAITVALLVAIARVGGVAVDRGRAQTAADAAALAGLTGGRAAAIALASANGATLVGWSRDPARHEVIVTVRVGDTSATARATDAP